MKKANKELLRIALEEYREASCRMQAETSAPRALDYGFQGF